MSKRKLEATKANQAKKQTSGRLPAGKKVKAGGGRGRLYAVLGAVAVVVVAAVVVVLATRGGDDGGGTPEAIPWNQLEGLQTGPPPWTEGIDGLSQRLDTVGLSELPTEGTVFHIHQHLDMWVNGKKVTLPANVGINQVSQYIVELHTHDTRGVLHVEAPKKETFSLGDAFAVWGVKLTPTCLGSFCNTGDKKLRAYLNGKPVTDPAAIVLSSHQEIVLTYGTKAQEPKKIPASYKFAAGE